MTQNETIPAAPQALPRLPAGHPLRRAHRSAVDGWYVGEWGEILPALIEPSTAEGYHAAHTARGSHSRVILGRIGLRGQAATTETDARHLALTYAAQAARRLNNAIDIHEFALVRLRRRLAEVAANADAAGGAVASPVSPAAALAPAPHGPSTAERFEWFVRGVITSAPFCHSRDMVIEELAKAGGIRALLQQAGMGGLGRYDWRLIACWFLNARRAERQ